ncbi:MAG: SpoVG family protein [Planctomycetota bacterium]
MEITEVRVKLVGGKQDKLKAFCSITIDDCFVIRDLKIIEGNKGLFVAMPSRKLTVRCGKCGAKNQIRSNYCGDCGYAIPQDRDGHGRDGRLKLHADVAHPINQECREAIQGRVLECFLEEEAASQEPGYTPKDLEEPEELEEFDFEARHDPEAAAPTRKDREVAASTRKDREVAAPMAQSSGPGGSRQHAPQPRVRTPERERDLAPEDPPPDDNFSVGIF